MKPASENRSSAHRSTALQAATLDNTTLPMKLLWRKKLIFQRLSASKYWGVSSQTLYGWNNGATSFYQNVVSSTHKIEMAHPDIRKEQLLRESGLPCPTTSFAVVLLRMKWVLERPGCCCRRFWQHLINRALSARVMMRLENPKSDRQGQPLALRPQLRILYEMPCECDE